MLDLFAEYSVAATWATVGFVFCGSRDELMASLPPEEARPSYADKSLSNYAYLDEIGRNEAEDPYYFGASLVDRILQTPRQEIGTHTLSHYYCLEPGQNVEQFTADLKAALWLAKQKGIVIKSIVFPRNQFSDPYLHACRAHGVHVYRGTPAQWAYHPVPGSHQTLLRRAGRLIDAHTGLLGSTTFGAENLKTSNVPASQFLRPTTGTLKPLHPLHRNVIKRGMSFAARQGRGYHLWWHPHNFGRDMEDNLSVLHDILVHFMRLQDSDGMQSASMAEATT
ncbi:MAG: polysaccharide deacetylase family protein [Caldilineaceae bacterium]|nr:polysaccharide deacetylase family protein [Caldilineaceae bacterium]